MLLHVLKVYNFIYCTSGRISSLLVLHPFFFLLKLQILFIKLFVLAVKHSSWNHVCLPEKYFKGYKWSQTGTIQGNWQAVFWSANPAKGMTSLWSSKYFSLLLISYYYYPEYFMTDNWDGKQGPGQILQCPWQVRF